MEDILDWDEFTLDKVSAYCRERVGAGMMTDLEAAEMIERAAQLEIEKIKALEISPGSSHG